MVPGVTAMAAITLASMISSIAGFAFSAICGAMLFHLVADPVQVVQVVAALLAIGLAHGAPGPWIILDPADLLFVPASLLATALGMGLFRRLSDLQLARAVNLLLIASGISYMI